tara:strand:+ start:8389 stop:8904 length:516 start_codon:yes stop_codon:yes gene_type:complete
MNDLIINKGTVQAHLQVAEGVDKKNFKRFIYEAQYIDLRELMCEVFYNDLVSNYTNQIYQSLLVGGSYVYEDKTYYYEGLEVVLSYFAYGRFITESNIQSTSFGMVRKNSQESERATQRELEAMADKNNDRALMLFESTKTFLDRNEETYTLWECSECDKPNEQNNIELWG